MTASHQTDMGNSKPTDVQLSQAAHWRLRLYASDSSADDWAEFSRWLEETPANAQAYDIVSENETSLADYLRDNPLEETEQFERRRARYVWPVAASIAVALVSAFAIAPSFFVTDGEPRRFATALGEAREFSAADGVQLALNGETEVVQSDTDASSFELIEGEVLVSIGPDALSSLELTVGSLKIVDRGTVFNVAKNSADYRITVAEGIVEITSPEAKVEIIAGQEATYDLGTRQITIGSIAPVNVGAWQEMRFEYAGVQLGRIMHDVSRTLGATFVQGECRPDATFAGTIQLTGQEKADAEQIAGLLGCSVRNDSGTWIFDD